jgi:hypothetical protein
MHEDPSSTWSLSLKELTWQMNVCYATCMSLSNFAFTWNTRLSIGWFDFWLYGMVLIAKRMSLIG